MTPNPDKDDAELVEAVARALQAGNASLDYDTASHIAQETIAAARPLLEAEIRENVLQELVGELGNKETGDVIANQVEAEIREKVLREVFQEMKGLEGVSYYAFLHGIDLTQDTGESR